MAPDEKLHVKRDDEAVTESPIVQSDVQPEGPVSVEERRLVRKLDRRILPITCLLYLFACQYSFWSALLPCQLSSLTDAIVRSGQK
jgi:hypothetical protein